MSHRSQIDILGPAGSFETLRAAINAGATSVFFGISEFNMRASAARNFQLNDLPEIVRICKEHNVKTNVTVNTLLYNNELEKMHQIVDAVKEHGADAIIAADMATIMYARQKGVEVHISTQLSISNTETVKFYSQFADRVVLARELTLAQVKEICDDIKEQDIRGPKGNLVEVEVFSHGALCVSVSGRCGMSLFTYGPEFSANRGKCTQVCRRRYKVTDIETNQELEIDNNYVMSPKDLATIGMLPELIATGVNVLKFEGRGRSPEYVHTVISTYREAIEAIETGAYTDEKVKEWNERLGTVFNKGFTTGFYMGRDLEEWSGVHGSKATQEKTIVGKVRKYYPKLGVVEIIMKAKETIQEGEEFSITGDTTGVVMGTIEDMKIFDENDKPLDKNRAEQGDIITFKVPSRVRVKDTFYVIRKRESLIPRGKESLLQ